MPTRRDRTRTANARQSAADAPATVERVPLAVIVRDEGYQVRKRMCEATVNAYANVLKSGRTMPPVKLARVDGALVLVDGWHRIAALEMNGEDAVEAEITPATAADARWLAAKANLEHGLPYKPREHREVFRCYVSSRQHIKKGAQWKSYRDIAEEVGGLRCHATIRNWMKKDFPRTAAKMGGWEAPLGREFPDMRKPPSMLDIARAALTDAEAASRGVNDPEEREKLVREVLATLGRIALAVPWCPAFQEPLTGPQAVEWVRDLAEAAGARVNPSDFSF